MIYKNRENTIMPPGESVIDSKCILVSYPRAKIHDMAYCYFVLIAESARMMIAFVLSGQISGRWKCVRSKINYEFQQA